MSEMIVLAVAVALLALLLVAQYLRAARQERQLREDLARVQVAVAEGQRDSLAQVSSQMTGVVERFHQAMGQFGQSVQSGQSATGEALRRELEAARRTMQEQLSGLVGAVNAQLGESQKSLGERFEGATKVFGELKGQLGQVAEMATRMEALGREIEELQGILKAPKLRGQLGEAQLEEFLRQVLPPAFWETQHRFGDGQTVDAVIRLRDHLVPVDAKFPLESFRRFQAAADDGARKTARREFERAVKGRIDEIADKYIRPGEGTFEFALMFIPAENIYYEVIIRDEGGDDSLLAYATARRVVPVSPNSFYAYLATIATGLKGMQVEARAREILAELGKLQREFTRFGESFRVLGKHLSSAQGKYEEAERLAGRIGDRLQGITGEEPDAALDPGAGASLPSGDD